MGFIRKSNQNIRFSFAENTADRRRGGEGNKIRFEVLEDHSIPFLAMSSMISIFIFSSKDQNNLIESIL